MRLTSKDGQGNWCLKGVGWEQLYIGQVITKKISEKLYGSLWKLREYEDTGLTPEEIMDGKMLTGWIPVEERLPKNPNAGIIEMEDLQEYIVMVDGAGLPTVLSYAGNGEWCRDGDFYKVLAWMPLPEPYRPEAGECREAAGGADGSHGALEGLKALFENRGRGW